MNIWFVLIRKIKRYPNRYLKMVATLHEHPMFINTKTFFVPSGCHTTERLFWSDFKSGQPATENPVFALGSSLLQSRKNACPKLGGRCVFSRFDQEQTASQNRQNSITSAFHSAMIFFLSSETKPARTRIFAFMFAKLCKLAKPLFSLCSLFVQLGCALNFEGCIPSLC